MINDFLFMPVFFSSSYFFECPLQYTFKVDGSTTFDENIFTVGEGSWMMWTDNTDLVGTTYAISIIAYSGTPGPSVPQATAEFDILVKPSFGCQNPTVVSENPLTISFW